MALPLCSHPQTYYPLILLTPIPSALLQISLSSLNIPPYFTWSPPNHQPQGAKMGSAHSRPRNPPLKARKHEISYPRPQPNSRPLHAYGYDRPPPPPPAARRQQQQYYHSKPLPKHPTEVAYYSKKPLPAKPAWTVCPPRKPVPVRRNQPPPRSQVDYYSKRRLPEVPRRR